MANKRELEFTTRLTREDVAGLIEALVEGLKDGHLKVQKSDDVLELAVPRVVDLKIEAEIDDERAEFEIEVSWLTNRAGSPDTVPDENPAAAQEPVSRPKTATQKVPPKSSVGKGATDKSTPASADTTTAEKKAPARKKPAGKTAVKKSVAKKTGA